MIMNMDNIDQNLVIGVDVGGQTSKCGIVDARGTVIAQTVIRTDNFDTVEPYIAELAEALTKLVKETGAEGKIRGIGVGAPNANYYTGDIENAVNLSWGRAGSIHFAAMLKDAMGGIPVTLTNDANAAAMGEMTYGAARGMKNFITITLGTGVGSGIVINGEMVYGHDGFAGELGHTTLVRHNGRLCNCGKNGCLEAYCSATGVARTAREFLELRDDPSKLRDYDIETITSKDVYDCAMAGDKLAKEIFNYTGTILGEALADFTNFSSPEAFVLFGGLTKSGDLIMNPVKEAFERNVLGIYKGKVKILISELKESDAAVLGASALGWEVKN